MPRELSPLLRRAVVKEIIQAINKEAPDLHAEESSHGGFYVALTSSPYTQVAFRVEGDD